MCFLVLLYGFGLIFFLNLPGETTCLPDQLLDAVLGNISKFPDVPSSDAILAFQGGFANPRHAALIKYIQTRCLVGISTEAYNLSHLPMDTRLASHGKVVDKLLGGRKLGFFLEYMAHDGDTESNTMFLEKERQWTGILVEPNPQIFRKVLLKHRKCYMINACLSSSNRSGLQRLRDKDYGANLRNSSTSFSSSSEEVGSFVTQCFPASSILLAMKTSYVDYASFNTGVADVAVLEAFPFQDAHVDVVSVDIRVRTGEGIVDFRASMEKLKATRRFFYSSRLFTEVPFERSNLGEALRSGLRAQVTFKRDPAPPLPIGGSTTVPKL